ncbi:MAG: family 10 glycosylhydrolase [Betaproteobacteria bacterium]|nr:family 10 glycosylhydrolase [Betaproteobacteria bacterium]
MVHQSLKRIAPLLAALALSSCADLPAPVQPQPAGNVITAPRQDPNAPPPLPREFRAAWVATVANIDWPSKPGLPVAEQQRELIAIVEKARELNLNALIVQVRPATDAMYASSLEPWSEFLTGEQGKPPLPFYDPLDMWVKEAHARGIELHAWFNPYRARHTKSVSPNAKNHVSSSLPQAVKNYGGFQWLDPGDARAADHTLAVILDVVKRYDIDAVHIDDYFYPYPVPQDPAAPAEPGKPVVERDFPDDPTWQAYVAGGGTLARNDWRRDNVNRLIERIYRGIQKEKPWMRFGVSPFGLGKPEKRPPGIAGFSQYDKLYADVELWLQKGWLDYLAPQLYWPIEQKAQAFDVLLDYWIAENRVERHIWPGLYTSRIDASARSWQPDELTNQIALSRTRSGSGGQVHFSMIALMENRKGISDALKTRSYAVPALVPASPWLDVKPPSAPKVAADVTPTGRASVRYQLKNTAPEPVRIFAVSSRYGDRWVFSTAPARDDGTASVEVASVTSLGTLNRVAVQAIDRAGNASPVTYAPSGHSP